MVPFIVLIPAPESGFRRFHYEKPGAVPALNVVTSLVDVTSLEEVSLLEMVSLLEDITIPEEQSPAVERGAKRAKKDSPAGAKKEDSVGLIDDKSYIEQQELAAVHRLQDDKFGVGKTRRRKSRSSFIKCVTEKEDKQKEGRLSPISSYFHSLRCD
ncbi:hypothetical protein P167DRAFT_573082 [Morchella conica CCBAS932]|uniref:Uncharacterized protein n=1 Tax=Morchella conica CCBAS932 TaxID=1392247 RepID=A0A3N4KT88_9PEZI|nr:hypothetical protein P167DRAFT_573082 [Morchella conica CCBAS932]